MMIAPCKGCENRDIGCHGTCNKYKFYYDLNEARKRKKSIDDIPNSYESSQIYKNASKKAMKLKRLSYI